MLVNVRCSLLLERVLIITKIDVLLQRNQVQYMFLQLYSTLSAAFDFTSVISIRFVAIVALVALVAVVALCYSLYQWEKFVRDSSHSRIGLVLIHLRCRLFSECHPCSRI